MNRFGDIDLSFKRLSPVFGYHSQKVVSLEKSLESIQSEIDQLDRYIKLAKKHCHYPSEHGLTHDESAAVFIYTMEWDEKSLYRLLNKSLRAENREELKIWFPYLKLFDCALEKLPTVNEVVWRGVPLDIGKSFTKNQLITWWTINSCSSSVDVIKTFLFNNKQSTLFLIEAKNGKKISGYTQFENEDEIILPIGTQLCVKSNSLQHQTGLNVVHLIEIDNTNEQNHMTTDLNNMNLNDNSTKKGATAFQEEEEENICSNEINNNNRKWKQNGITIAGGNGQGNQLNQLNEPDGIFLDEQNQSIYIVDSHNHRIVKWKFGQTSGQIVAGGNGPGNQLNQLNFPTDVIIDQNTQSMIISDKDNHRILQWPLNNPTQGKILLSNIDPNGLAIDNNGFLYVSDSTNNEVRKFRIGDQNGQVVAGGNGKGKSVDQLNEPSYIFVDQQRNIYISDTKNHRIVKWTKGAKEGIIVAGGQGKGDSLAQLDRPQGLVKDHLDNLFIADNYNQRIMCWSNQSKQVQIIIGANGKGQRQDQFNHLSGLALDRHGNIYVADWNNHRILRFDRHS